MLLSILFLASVASLDSPQEQELPATPEAHRTAPGEKHTPTRNDALLELPPPPAGMKLLGPEEARAFLLASAATDPEPSEEIAKESEELEELRALEELSLDPGAKQRTEMIRAFRRLGFDNPLRGRLAEAVEKLRADDVLPSGDLLSPADLDSFDIRQVSTEYDIPIEMQPLVVQYIRFFQGPGRKWFARWMARSTRYIPAMQKILVEQGLPRDTVYLAMIESGFSSQAYSWAHASGPWQFIPATGRIYGLRQDFWVDERRDPLKATLAAARYLSSLYRDLGHWYLAWAAYNAGGGRLQRLIAKRGTSDFWKLSEGRGLPKETKHYVPKLIACALVAKHPKAFGFTESDLEFLPPLEFDEVRLHDVTDLDIAARAAEASPEVLRELNPEIKRWCTPPASPSKPYVLRLPKGSAVRFAENFAKLGPQERFAFRSHTIRRGDTLSAIARIYGSAPEAIMRLNGLTSARALRLGTTLMVPIPAARASGRAEVAQAVLEKQVSRARRNGFVAARPEEEIPAGTPPRIVSGTAHSETVGGRLRITYTVQAGDNLWALGRRFGCSVEDIRRWNHLSGKRSALRPGTPITLWPPAPPPVTSTPPVQTLAAP